MDLGLNGRVVVITGGGTGIGRAAALEFAREGCRVCILGRREAPLQDAAAEAAGQGLTLLPFCCDVADRDAVQQTADQIAAQLGGIDVWVNNAGVTINKPFLEFTDEDFDAIAAINLRAVFHCTQIAARIMKVRGKGVILNASSFASRMPHANGAIYAATKAGVNSLTRSSASALAPYGIRVLAYIPGMVVTPISEEQVAVYKDRYVADIALGRLGRPEDLAPTLVFLASDRCSYISGTEIEITGGKFASQDCGMPWRFEKGLV